VRQACAGLEEAHRKGIVHLKPSNLFLAQRPDGTSLLKVLDFGVSKLMHAEGERRRRTIWPKTAFVSVTMRTCEGPSRATRGDHAQFGVFAEPLASVGLVVAGGVPRARRMICACRLGLR
jgi:serine/threonine protein kinase